VPKIRVLIVDDAVVIRKLVTDALSADPDLEIVGSAANGRIALQKIPQVNPDVVTLDVEMPEMDGLETLRQLRPDYPKLPVIMFSTLTERGAQVTLDALALGASDYVTKPMAVAGGLTEGLQRIREDAGGIRVIDAMRQVAFGLGTGPKYRQVYGHADRLRKGPDGFNTV